MPMWLVIQHSVAVALYGNIDDIKNNKKFKQILQRQKKLLQDIQKKKVTEEYNLKGNFAQSQLAKMSWNHTKRYFVNKTMKEELKLLIKVMSNGDQFKQETPIAHSVPRTPDFTTDGDSSLHAAGGFSLSLKFQWYLDWPEHIKARNIKEIKKDNSGKLISIILYHYSFILGSTTIVPPLGVLQYNYPIYYYCTITTSVNH